jgi:hypothetical protein
LVAGGGLVGNDVVVSVFEALRNGQVATRCSRLEAGEAPAGFLGALAVEAVEVIALAVIKELATCGANVSIAVALLAIGIAKLHALATVRWWFIL